MCFPLNFVKFKRTSFLQNTFGRLLLQTVSSDCITVCQHNFEQQKVFKLPAIILKTTLWHLCSPKFSKHLFHRTCETAAFQTLYATYYCFSSKETKYGHLKLFLSFQKASLKPYYRTIVPKCIPKLNTKLDTFSLNRL